MWHSKGRWKYGPLKADMNTHADTTIPSPDAARWLKGRVARSLIGQSARKIMPTPPPTSDPTIVVLLYMVEMFPA